ncbi:MAG: alpha/beta hydrolase [Novosphingobium sp.]|nr:alpha/beta hydrolase [Novosphingobium sp.]
MATFVLVHGGGHGGWCYAKVARRLREAGHLVYCPTLSGLADRAHLVGPEIDLNTHIEDVARLIFFEDLTDVILAGHSYGGMVITGVGDRVPERIAHLVFLDAALPRNSETLFEIAASQIGPARTPDRTINDVEMAQWPDVYTPEVFGVSDPEDIVWMAERLTPHPWKCYVTPLELTNEAAMLAIPRTIINCTPTLGVRPKDKLQRVFEAERVWEIDTGHDLMVTEPEKTAEMLLRVAAL